MELDRKLFENWLEIFEDTDIVGYIRKACTCPIATYMMSAGEGFRKVEVFEDEFVTFGDEVLDWQIKNWDLPTWAQTFITQVDAWAEDKGVPIPAKAARQILASIDE